MTHTYLNNFDSSIDCSLKRRSFLATAASVATAFKALPVLGASEAFPSRAIRFVVPNPAGGLPDTVARIFAQHLGERLGQPITVDNKPGANGVIAAQALANAPKDGYTMMVADGSMFSINPVIYKALGYDFKRDFEAVSLAARAPLYLAVHPKVKATNLKELIALIKSQPGVLTYGSSGVGSTHHLSMEEFKSALSLDITHVPFKGSGQSVPALIGGQIDMVFSALPSLSGFVKTNQVRLIAVNSLKRSPQEPSLPAISEFIPGYDFAPIIGVFTAKGTPQVAIEKIAIEMKQLAKLPELIQILTNAGIEPVGDGPIEYTKAVLAENERLGKVVKQIGISQE